MTLDQVNQFNQQLGSSVNLQRLDGADWVQVATIPAVRPPPTYIEHPAGLGVTVPPLTPGEYRLVTVSPTDGVLTRQFWVIDPPPQVDLLPQN
jgi:hypothetical protein